MMSYGACFTRGFFKDESNSLEEWLTQQLKATREQLSKKSDFCDQLADQLRELESDLKARTTSEYEAREKLNVINSELRAASRTNEQQEAHNAELTTLAEAKDAEIIELRRQLDAEIIESMRRLKKESCDHILKSALHVDCTGLTPRGNDGKRIGSKENIQELALWPADETDEISCDSHPGQLLHAEVEKLQATLDEAASREADLQQQLKHEKELHTEALRMLSYHQAEGVEKRVELDEELVALSSMLEQKEEDILSIKFDMVELQNRLADQARLVSENADSFQWASEELAEKDEKLSDAIGKQEDLLAQMNSVSDKLQGKVEDLAKELDNSRAAYQALDEQTRAVVSGLESERDSLINEMGRLRAETDEVRAELQSARDAAQEARARVQQEENRASQLAAALEEAQKRVQSLEPGAVKAQTLSRARSEQVVRKCELELQDQLVAASERIALAEVQIQDLTSALERAQCLERQAIERAQEYRTSLELYREFGNEDFMQSEIGFPGPLQPKDEETSSESGDKLSASNSCLSSVLISVDVDLGFSTASLNIAPWQTKADFDIVVKNFLEEHKVKPLFADALVRYLEEVEANAKTFPIHVTPNLMDIYSRYS